MKKKICVYTCITGEYDDLREIEKPEKGVDYYCFTNNKNLKSKTWKIIQIKNERLDNQRLSRKIKMLGEPSVFKNYEISVWMDASVIWDKSVVKFVEEYLGDSVFAAFCHSQRNTVKDEAGACLWLRKDGKEPIIKTLDFLKEENFPDNIGLFEMTVFIKRHNDRIVKQAMALWFEMVQSYSKRDQLSFPYAAWKTKLSVSRIKLDVWSNEWFHSTKHRLDRKIEDCLVYFGNPDIEFDFEKCSIFKYANDGDAFFFETILPCDTSEIAFNFAEAIGTRLTGVKITPEPERMIVYGVREEGRESFLCTRHNVVRAFGDFRKGEKLRFNVAIELLDEPGLLNLLENLWLELARDSKELRKENNELKQELEQIRNSRAWKLVSSAGKIIHRF